MRHAALAVAGGLLMAQTAQSPPAENKVIAELQEIHADINRFANQHGQLFVSFDAVARRMDDIQRQVNEQQARIDASDPTKAAEKLTLLMRDLEERKQRAAEERAESARNWQAVWGVSRWFGGILTVVAGNEIRKWFSSRKFRMTIEKAVVKPDTPAGGVDDYPSPK